MMTKRDTLLVLISTIAVLHLLVCLIFHSLLLSNGIQLAAAGMAAALCLIRARKSEIRHFRRLWYGPGVAFSLWAIGQSYDVWYIAVHKSAVGSPSPADFFWMIYAFPLLLVAACVQDEGARSYTGILDWVQACISAGLLFVVILLIPAHEVIARVYDILGVALLFVCTIRYSTASSDTERIFFRNLTIFAFTYDILGLATQVLPPTVVMDGGIRGLAFSLPFLIFCAAAIRFPEKLTPFADRVSSRTVLPAHVYSISSLGLALTSVASGVLLAVHHRYLGFPGIAVSCSVFALRTAATEAQLKRTQLQLEHDSLYDHLTGLVNRVYLTRELERQNALPAGHRWLLLLGLDRFKIINDTLGHEVGDRILIQVANLLKSVVRSGDIVARFGGDEFVILLNSCHDSAAARAIAERILTFLRTPIQLEQRVVQITGSIGAAALQDGESAIELLHRADAATYMAKSLGKNCVRIFDRPVLEETARRLEMEADLRQAIEDGVITVAYQPIFSLESQALEGFEALARWTHPTQGQISPDEFIPVAENTGLILELGKQVLGKACRQVAEWNHQFEAELTVSVNISGRQLTDRAFLNHVSQILRESQLPPSFLKFEITESVLLDDQLSATGILDAARSMGIEIYLDDFGKGYSALNYLVEFPVDTIKIDRRFVQNVERDDNRAIMLDTIVQLARRLQKKVVAEGIESFDQLRFITAIRCDYVQGFLFSKPLHTKAMTDLLNSMMTHKEGSAFSLPAFDPEFSRL